MSAQPKVTLPDRIPVRRPAEDRETLSSVPADDAQRIQQEAGLAALVGIAVQVSRAMSETVATTTPRAPFLPSDSGTGQSFRGF